MLILIERVWGSANSLIHHNFTSTVYSNKICFSFRFTDNVLSDKDCENVYELVYSSHRAVAQAAGDFLNTKLFTREPDEATKNMKSKKGKKRSVNTPLIRDLVQFFIESEVSIS